MCRNHSEKQLRNKKTSDLCEPGKCGESELHQNKCCYITLVCPKHVILQFWIVASYTKDHLNTQLSRSVDVHLHGKSVFLGQYVILGMSYKYGQEPYCITITGFCVPWSRQIASQGAVSCIIGPVVRLPEAQELQMVRHVNTLQLYY